MSRQLLPAVIRRAELLGKKGRLIMNMTPKRLIVLLSLIALVASCRNGLGTSEGDMKKIADVTVSEGLTVALSSADGKLKRGEQEISLSFLDGSGKPYEITAASLNFKMPAMGSMAEMNNPATLSTTETPGKFKGKVTIEMPGEWIAQISYEGKEKGTTTMKVTAY